MTEEWADIRGYEGLYKISTFGRILSLSKTFKTGRNHSIEKTYPETIMSPSKTKKGYLRVNLFKDGKLKSFQVHRLVAEAFIPNPNNYPEVNHINEVKDCNIVDNLEWCTGKYNINYTKAYLTSQPKAVEKVKRPILQLNLAGEFIKEWASMSDASNALNLNLANLCLCCKGKRNKCGNYKWKYKEYEN